MLRLSVGIFALSILQLPNHAWGGTASYEEQLKEAEEAYEYAQLSDKTYGQGAQNAGSWEVASDIQGGLKEFTVDRKTGFSAAVYRNVNTGEIAVAFEGSQGWALPKNGKEFSKWSKDWIDTNLRQGASLGIPKQYTQADRYITEVRKACGCDVTVTGHSLGGGLAQYVAWSQGLKAYTFNPVGLNLQEIRKILKSSKIQCKQDASRIKNLIVRGDFAQTFPPTLVGKKIVFDFPRGKGPGSLLERHDMKLFLHDLQRLKNLERAKRREKRAKSGTAGRKNDGSQQAGPAAAAHPPAATVVSDRPIKKNIDQAGAKPAVGANDTESSNGVIRDGERASGCVWVVRNGKRKEKCLWVPVGSGQ